MILLNPNLYFIFNRKFSLYPIVDSLLSIRLWKIHYPESKVLFFVQDQEIIPKILNYFDQYLDDIQLLPNKHSLRISRDWYDWEVLSVCNLIQRPTVIFRNSDRSLFFSRVNFSEKYILLSKKHNEKYTKYWENRIDDAFFKSQELYSFPGFYYFPDPKIANLYGNLSTRYFQILEEKTRNLTWIQNEDYREEAKNSCFPHTLQESFYSRLVKNLKLPFQFLETTEVRLLSELSLEEIRELLGEDGIEVLHKYRPAISSRFDFKLKALFSPTERKELL